MKYVAAALIGGLFFTAAISQQSERTPDSFRVGLDAVCTDDETFAATLLEFEERPMLTGTSYRTDGGNNLSFGAVLFVNPNTGTWTMAERVEPNVICVIGMGERMQPYYPDQEQPSRPRS